jgi:hypothetical protein
MTKPDVIAVLNDQLRSTFQGGKVFVTPGVASLPAGQRAAVLMAVQTFTDFSPDNDPRGEHDFGDFAVAGQRYFFKIDYYDPTMEYGSEDPADPAKTARVLTIMLASEY